MIIQYDQVLNRLYFNNISPNGHSIDDGNSKNFAVDTCHNCESETMHSTVSTHFCINCLAFFNYWGRGTGNTMWDKHEQKYHANHWYDVDGEEY